MKAALATPSPQLLGQTPPILGSARQMAVQNGIAYISARESGLWIVDCRNPQAPKVLTRYDCCELATGHNAKNGPTAGMPEFKSKEMATFGKGGPGTGCGHGLDIFDVSDPYSPRQLKSWKFSGNPDVPVFHKSRVLIPCGYQGVLMQKAPPSMVN